MTAGAECCLRQKNFLPNDENIGWDGFKLGQALDPGVYTWQALLVLTDGVQKIISGDVVLMR